MVKHHHNEHVVINNFSGGQVNYANHGSTVNVSNGQTDELARLIQELRRELAHIDQVSSKEKEETLALLDYVQKEKENSQPNSVFVKMVLERLQKWQPLFGAASGTGQIISALVDVLSKF